MGQRHARHRCRVGTPLGSQVRPVAQGPHLEPVLRSLQQPGDHPALTPDETAHRGEGAAAAAGALQLVPGRSVDLVPRYRDAAGASRGRGHARGGSGRTQVGVRRGVRRAGIGPPLSQVDGAVAEGAHPELVGAPAEETRDRVAGAGAYYLLLLATFQLVVPLRRYCREYRRIPLHPVQVTSMLVSSLGLGLNVVGRRRQSYAESPLGPVGRRGLGQSSLPRPGSPDQSGHQDRHQRNPRGRCAGNPAKPGRRTGTRRRRPLPRCNSYQRLSEVALWPRPRATVLLRRASRRISPPPSFSVRQVLPAASPKWRDRHAQERPHQWMAFRKPNGPGMAGYVPKP